MGPPAKKLFGFEVNHAHTSAGSVADLARTQVETTVTHLNDFLHLLRFLSIGAYYNIVFLALHFPFM